MSVLAVIAARAGSKGVRSKNLLTLHGRPVLSFTVDDARAAACVDRIVVSTESADIARVARDCGVEVIDRPPELARDDTRLDYVLRHALDVLAEKGNCVPEIVVLLYGNCPLREEGIIDRCVGHLRATGADSVRTFSSTGKYHPQWMNRIEGDRVTPYEPLVAYRRQDLEPLYIHDGACVAMTHAALADSVNHLDDNFCLFGHDRRGLICPDGATVEIDSPWDVYAAEAALRRRRETGRHYGDA
ncbi:MAG TPA: acylneuraminate cytidylyltransferase family protein [Acidimicrobiia bacterium]|nr:acylneuraminate cytidylyltransferase family protein [Acidimicrobiia bacterium]